MTNSPDDPPPDAANACLEADDMERFAEGSLTHEQRTRIEIHIDRCAWCRRGISEIARSFDDDEVQVRKVHAPWSLAPGTNVGRYVIVGPIGLGGMGVVYAAYDPKLDRKVAIKMLRAGSDDGPGARDRLEREARAMAKLSHPNVVAIYDIGVLDEQLFLAMEFIDGVTLRSWMAHASRPAERVLAAFIQAGRGLEAAHAAGLVHRDFKPENVLCTLQGRVCVTDFGLAHHATGAPLAAASLAGTPLYIAPEVYAGQPADARSDQFSFCIALYEALYRQHPFEGKTWSERFEAAREERLREPPGDAVVLPRAHAALLRGLRADPAGRFESMTALLAVLTNQPATRRWRLVAVMSIAIAAIAIPLSYWHARTQSLRACEDAGRLSGTWNNERKNAVRTAFLGVDKPFALDAWNGVERALDAYTRDWAAARALSCEVMYRHDHEPEKSAAHLACLDERVKDVAALTDVFAQADAVVVSRAMSAVQSLQSVSSCSHAGGTPVQAHADAETAAKVNRIRNELSKVHALREAGKYREAIERAEAAVRGAEALTSPRLRGEALFRYGDALGITGDALGAEAALRRALTAADAAGDDLTRARAWSLLLYDVGYLQGKHELVALLNEQAEAALTRAGGDDAVDAMRRYYFGTALAAQGHFEAAVRELESAHPVIERAFGSATVQMSRSFMAIGLAHMEQGEYEAGQTAMGRALEIGEAVVGPNHPLPAVIRSNLGVILERQMRFDEALTMYLRALKTAEDAGEEEFTLAIYLNNVGEIMLEQGQYEPARANFERDLAVRAKQLGANSPHLIFPLTGLGEAHLGLGQPKIAVSHLERAVRAHGDAGAESKLAQAKFALTRALWASGGDRHRARALAVEARDGFSQSHQRSPLDERNRGRVTQWLEEHPHD